MFAWMAYVSHKRTHEYVSIAVAKIVETEAVRPAAAVLDQSHDLLDHNADVNVKLKDGDHKQKDTPNGALDSFEATAARFSSYAEYRAMRLLASIDLTLNIADLEETIADEWRYFTDNDVEFLDET